MYTGDALSTFYIFAANNPRPWLISVFIHETDYIQQGNELAVQNPKLKAYEHSNLTLMLQEINSYERNVFTLQDSGRLLPVSS